MADRSTPQPVVEEVDDMAKRLTPVQVGLPARIDGAIVRLMSDGTTDWTEAWQGTNVGWSRHGQNFQVREFLKAIPASKELLAEYGIPS